LFHKNSYTIRKGPLEERCGEQTKAKINVSQSKISFVSRWKSLRKGGDQLQVDGEGKGLRWSHQMGLHMCQS
jgi:hypothetical protein